MAFITLYTNFTKNSSLQVGDQIYYLGTNNNVKRIGPLENIETNYIVCTAEGDLSQLTSSSYIFFGKDNSKNTSGILGYYAEVNLKNNSKDHAELFAVNSEIFKSSN